MSIYASRIGRIWSGSLSRQWFDALVDDEDAFDILGSGCLDAPAQMPSGSMVSNSVDRIDQGLIGRGDDDLRRDEMIKKILSLRSLKTES